MVIGTILGFFSFLFSKDYNIQIGIPYSTAKAIHEIKLDFLLFSKIKIIKNLKLT